MNSLDVATAASRREDDARATFASEGSGAPVLCAILARTARGRRQLVTAEGRSLARFGSPEVEFWVEPTEGVAIQAPHLRRGRTEHGDSRWFFEGNMHGVQDVLPPLAALRGDFALALWDAGRRALSLVRDPIGQRGLFVRRSTDFYYVSSDLRALLDLDSVELDAGCVLSYLAHGRPAPGATLAQEVQRVPAGHALEFTRGGVLVQRRYWTPLSDEAETRDSPALRAKLEQSLRRDTSDCVAGAANPGILLSGGLDSSYLASLAASEAGGRRLRAYTIEFPTEYGMNEVEFATLVARKFDLEHRVVSLSNRDALADLDAVLSEPDPCGASAIITHRALLRAARADGVDRLLSGLGSDEVFASYTRMLAHYFLFKAVLDGRPREAPSAVWRDLLSVARGRELLFPGVATFFEPKLLAGAVSAPFRFWDLHAVTREFYRECSRLKPEAHIFELMVAHEAQHRIPDLLLANFEASSRAGGVECVYPFLAPELVALVAPLRASSRFRRSPSGEWITKLPLRRLAAGALPKRILERPRMSFAAPLHHWLHDPHFARVVRARLRRSGLFRSGCVDPRWSRRLLDEVLARARTKADGIARENRLWALLTLSGWYERYVDRAK